MRLTLMSFGFKHGMPEEVNIVLDVRFLQNPYWVEALKDKTGLDEDVGAYIADDQDFSGFLERTQALVTPLLAKYPEECQDGFTIAIGCTGGRHRSVYTVEMLAKQLAAQGITTLVEHRDIDL